MDIERGILKAIFYDYPVDTLVQLIAKSYNMLYDVYLDIIPQLLQWSKPEYTYTESNLLRIQTGGEWKDDYSTLHHPFDALSPLSKNLLTMENSQPRVRFEQLFRWKEVTMYVGEDLLVTSFIAQYHITHPEARNSQFLWSDILQHNNYALNEELSKGLPDLHAHYYATADVFALNWISMMNLLKSRKQLSKKINRSQDVELMTTQTSNPSSINQQAIAAAYLRFVFYRLLFKESDLSKWDATSIEYDYQHKVISILRNPEIANTMATRLQSAIKNAQQQSLKTTQKGNIDYCIIPAIDKYDQLTLSSIENVNYLYEGERRLLYTFFCGYYSHDPKSLSMAPYVYLYVLIKNKIRREIVQINNIKGFENFETYQNRKDILIPRGGEISKHFAYCVFASSTNSFSKDYFELRVTPKNLITEKFDYNNAIFTRFNQDSDIHNKNERAQLPSIVAHFIKKGEYAYDMPSVSYHIGKIKDGTRDNNYRRSIRKQLNTVLQFRKKRNVVGIDAASSEIFCRPETFGHVYRYALAKGMQGRTYHVGEDFLDLSDGLRAIDEAILFLQLDNKSRLGHAMALGIDAAKYYERRHFTTVITQQYLLDDCVWLLLRSKELGVKINSVLERKLRYKISELADKIGYNTPLDVEEYWYSMLLRGNDPQYNSSNKRFEDNEWDKTANINDMRLVAANVSNRAKELYHDYFYNPTIKEKGMLLVRYKWDKEIVEVINGMQKKMQTLVSKKGIGIECCPTSNLKIGFIDRYEQHPLLTRFYPIDADASYPLIKCSINTDDRGVFYTSIYEEYSLIALALYKMKDEKTGEPKYNEREILRYIGEIRKNAQQMAFRNYTDNK